MRITLKNLRKTLGLVTALLTLTMVALSSTAILQLIPAHATGPYSVNSIRNGGFEAGVDSTGLPVYWQNETHDCHCQPAPTITVNNTEPLANNAARLDLGQTQIGFMGMWQAYPQNTLFSNFTERPDEIDFWFRLDPKYAGLGDFQIKFLAQNAQELDYVIDPDPRLSYPNQTATICYSPCTDPARDALPNQPSVKYIFIGSLNNQPPFKAPPNTWVHFTRDVTADWTAPMLFTSNSTCTATSPCMLPGFPLTDLFARLELDNIGFQDSTVPISGGYYGMTTWIDEIKFYWSSNTPPPPPPPPHFLEFNFTDITGATVIDRYVKWEIFNATGTIGPYARGAKTLPDFTYRLEVAYPAFTGQSPEPYLIYQSIISLDTNTTITLPLVAEPRSPGELVAFIPSTPRTPTILNTTTTLQDSTRLTVNVKSINGASYTMIAGVFAQPKAVIKTTTVRTELFEGADWNYNSSLSFISLNNVNTAAYTIYFQQPPRIQNITFWDRNGTNVNNLLAFNMTDSRGTLVPIVQGQVPPDVNFPYYLQAYYQGHRIYRDVVINDTFSRTFPIQLEMLQLPSGYLAINSTIVGVDNIQQSSTSLTFNLLGSGPFLVLVHVPQKPIYVEINGAKIFWDYEVNYQTVVIETPSQGSIALFYTAPPPQPQPVNPTPDYTNYYIAAGILGGSIAAATAIGLYFTRRQKTELNTPQPGVTNNLITDSKGFTSGDNSLTKE